MAKEYFDGRSHYAIFGTEDQSYGTGTPLLANKIEKVQDISYTFNNNIILSQSVGGGADATSTNYGNFDVTGSFTVKPTDFQFMNFSSGSVDGAGTAGDPYQIVDGDNVGTSGTMVRSATFEIGGKATNQSKTYVLNGVVYNSWTMSGNQGEELQTSVDFIGQTVKVGTTSRSFTAGTQKTMVFLSGSVGWNDEELACTAFSFSGDWPTNSPREVFNRLVKQPTKGVRRHRWTLTLNKHYDDASGVISATELMDEFFGATNHPASSGTPLERDLYVTVNTGSKVVKYQLEDSVLGDWAENPSLEGGVVSVTVNGTSLSGKSETNGKISLKWWSI